MISRLKDTILLVSDKQKNRTDLRNIFEEEYNLLEAEDLSQATLFLQHNDSFIAAVLIDEENIPDKEMDSFNKAAHMGEDLEIPVLFLVQNESQLSSRALPPHGESSRDVILKPYTATSLHRRVQVLINLHLHKWHLQELLRKQSETIRNTNQVMMDALSAIIESRSTESGNHVLRIRRFTQILLRDIAKTCPEYELTEDMIDIISRASALHDIGKISIPDAILNKPGKLTADEFAIMKTHTTSGGELIQTLTEMGDPEYLRFAYNIALYHHERWDGNGYPCGLEKDEIPICAQAVSIADVFDALTTPRVYKGAVPFDQAFNMIMNNECGAFSPRILECFKHVRAELVALARQYADGYSPKDDTITTPLPQPNWKNHVLSTSQLSQIKYHTTLHYLNDTVLELDLDMGLFHVVYNPNPDLDSLAASASFANATDMLSHIRIHPDDIPVNEEIYFFLANEFFQQKIQRKVFRLRILSPSQNNWQPYELTFLRINTENESQHIAINIWHKIAPSLENSEKTAQPPRSFHESPALQGLTGSILRCRCDKELTIGGGAENLLPLTGYTAEEIRELFQNSLLNMIFASDKDTFAANLKEHFLKGGRQDYEFRIQCKGNTSRWILGRSRVYAEADGSEYLYIALHDHQERKAIEKDLLNTLERNQLIIDQSGDIVFEWDLQKDSIYISPKWEKRFGYTPISKNYGANLGIATHFHPDDLIQVRDLISRIQEGKGPFSIEVRIANSFARYLWARIIAAFHEDKDTGQRRILGLIQDIHTLKTAELEMKNRAEIDALTSLFNKNSAQQMGSKYLENREQNELAAMLLLDLDNFKAINDIWGHLYGDMVLKRVSESLKSLFRSNDIVARVGGDEFLVLMKNIPNKDLVNSRCEILLEMIQSLLEQLAPKANASLSIGVALVPDHGTSYTNLYTCADEALYASKYSGKNTFTVFNPLQIATTGQGKRHNISRIDSEEQPGMANASIIRFIFRRLYESTDTFKTLNEILAYVGEELNVSRVYIFENSEDNTYCSNTFEWCNQGIAPEIQNLQNISYEEDIAGWPEVFNEQGIFYCTDISSLKPHFREILEPQGIKSMLQCKILDNSKFCGYVGFDECTTNREWPLEYVSLLQFLAEILSLFLLKKRAQDRIVLQQENLYNILNQQDLWIYVIDPDTCELQFMNKKTMKRIPSARAGQLCYEAFLGRTSRCEKCIALKVEKGKSASRLLENAAFAPLCSATATEILWNDKRACLVYCKKEEEDEGSR